VSDLFCAVRLVVARHAEAAFVEDWFSDEGGSLTPGGRRQAAAIGAALTGERVAAVWSSDASRAVQTAEIAAAALGVQVTARKALREVYVGDLLGGPFDVERITDVADRWGPGRLEARFAGGESGAEVVARHRDVLAEIADLYRGEAVLVVGHQMSLGIAVPLLAGVAPQPQHRLGHAEWLELSGDADGWRLQPGVSAPRRP
jgi:broad specificity phosphatase PhoE